MKFILHAIPSSRVAGTEKAISELMSFLKSSGLSPDISETFARHGQARTIRHLLHIAYFVTLIFRQETVHIAFSHSTNILLCLLKIFKKNSTVIVCEHLPFSSKSRFQQRLAKVIYRRADAIVTLTERDSLNYDGKTYIIPNYIEISDRFLNIEISSVAPNIRGFNVSFVGRASYQKGFDFLPQIVNYFEDGYAGRSVFFEIIGDGDLLAPTMAKLSEHKSVVFHGYLENGEVLSKLENSHLIILPSRYEAFPFSLLEALSVGCPFVAFDCETGPAEISGPGVSWLAENDDVPSFIAAMKAAFDETLERSDIKPRCRLRAKKFDKLAWEARWHALLLDLPNLNFGIRTH